MDSKKAYSLSTMLAIFLVTFGTLIGTAFQVNSDQSSSSQKEKGEVTINSFHFNKVGLASSDWSLGGIEFSGKVDGEYISPDFVFGLQSLKREIRAQIAVCSQVQILFGIREIIFPSHFFW